MTSDDVPPKRGKARWLYEKLRRSIEHGERPDGCPLPSEKDLEEQYPTLSKRPIRDAVIELAAIGRVIKHHGKLTSSYMPSMEPHQLIVDLREPSVDLREPSFVPLARVAEPGGAAAGPAAEFVPASGSKIHTQWHEGKFIVPEWDSQRLGIDTGTNLCTYTLTLSIADEPILTSTTLVPTDLLGGAVTWHETPIGELALAGVSATFNRVTVHSRVPTLDEAQPHNPVPGIPAFAFYRQCQVTPNGGVPAPPRRACVLILARADRVHL